MFQIRTLIAGAAGFSIMMGLALGQHFAGNDEAPGLTAILAAGTADENGYGINDIIQRRKTPNGVQSASASLPASPAILSDVNLQGADRPVATLASARQESR